MTDRRWEIIGAPFGFGSEYEGTAEAPEAIRTAGLTRRIEHLRSLGVDVVDRGDLTPPPRGGSDRTPKGLDEMTAYAPALVARQEAVLNEGGVPIVLGGDHSITIASAAAVGRSLRGRAGDGASVGLIWVDAHPDFETPGPHGTNTLNAMPVTHILGRGVADLRAVPELASCVDPEDLVFIGLRDVLPEEREAIRELGVRAYTASDVERLGIDHVCRDAFGAIAERTNAVVLTFDIDVLDPSVAPGVDYPELGGLTSREGAVIMEYAHRLETLALAELVEVNPVKDRDAKTLHVAGQLLHRLIEGPLL